ncbi:MAG: metal ABC transporter substrate-binding protein [Candidatus Bathyarchaeia archaeon]
MPLNKATLAIIIAAIPLLLAGFNALTVFSNPDNKILKVAVLIDFLKAIVSPIVDELREVYSIVSGEVEPHSFTLTPEVIQIARDSDLIVVTGHIIWEEELVRQTAEVKGASSDLISINIMNLDGIKILSLNGDRNIHGFWLLPDNALIIAREVKEKLSALKPELSEELSDNYERFREEIFSLKNFLNNLSSKYGSHNRSVVIGFHAEQYVTEAMGLKVGSMLIGEEEEVRPASLRRISKQTKARG